VSGRPQDRLLKRLRDELGIELPEQAEIRRTHAGRVQRSQGAWSWFVHIPLEAYKGGQPQVGSHWQIRQLMAARRLEVSKAPWGDLEIGPEAAERHRLLVTKRREAVACSPANNARTAR
jgi:hypothetical protein